MVLVCKEKVRTRRLSLVGMMAAAQAASDDGCSYKTLIPISNVLAKEVTGDEGKWWSLVEFLREDLGCPSHG